MLKASPSGADKIQSFPDLRQMLLYAALGGIVLAALFAPWLTDVSPLDQDLMNLDQPFSPAHPLGTDSRTDHPAGHRFAALHRYGVGAEFPWTGKLAG